VAAPVLWRRVRWCDRACFGALLPASQLQLSSGRTLQESRRPGRRPGVQQPSSSIHSVARRTPAAWLSAAAWPPAPSICPYCSPAPSVPFCRTPAARPTMSLLLACSSAVRPALSPAACLLVGPCCSAGGDFSPSDPRIPDGERVRGKFPPAGGDGDGERGMFNWAGTGTGCTPRRGSSPLTSLRLSILILS
jgi:hypothetical protein